MKYYILKGTIKGTGANPQSESYTQVVIPDNPENMMNMNYDPDFHCNLEYVDLVPKAKITDVITTAANKVMAKVVSQKFVDIVRKFNCSSFNLYPVKLRKGETIFDQYYMLKFNEDSFKYINNMESKIQLNFEDNSIDFSKYSKEDFIKLFDNELKGQMINGKMFFFYHFNVQKVIFDVDFERDFFSLRKVPTPHPGIYLSERLVEALKQEGITGAEFKDVKQIVA